MTQSSADCWAVIPATGVGSRMQADRPKQYLQLQGKTLLEHTLDNLLSFPSITGLILVLHPQDAYWSGLQYQSEKPLLICEGGVERHHSVFNGLSLLQQHADENCLVMIHDAVRPFVMHQDLDRLLAAAQETDSGAILGAPVADTLKLNDNGKIAGTRSRSGLWRAFTPQAFRLSLISRALQNVIDQQLEVTDDASAMEMAGFQPLLINSDLRNIKITHPQDLELARLLLPGQEQDK